MIVYISIGNSDDKLTQAREVREVLTKVREKYRQDSVAWAVAETEFI